MSTELTLILPCDMPLLPDNPVSRLTSALGTHNLVVAHDGQRLLSLVMLARTEVLATIQGYLMDKKRSVVGWYEGLDHAVVQFREGSDAFLNSNETSQIWLSICLALHLRSSV